MGISKITYGSGDNKFEISYIDNEVIATSGANSYMSNNFEANSFAAYQNKSQTQFFEAGDNTSYSGADEHNCMWRKWDGNNKTDLFPGADNPDGYYTFNCLLTDYNGRRIITELTDIQRVVWRPEIMEEIVHTRINGVLTNVNTYRINTDTNQYYCDIIDATNPTHYTAQCVPISPWLLYPQDKKQLQLHYTRHDGISPWGSSCTRAAGVRNTGSNNARTYPLSTAMVNYDVPTGNNQNFGFYSDDNKYLFYCTLSTNNYASGDVRCYICSEDELKKWLASSGLKFIYKGRMYKPVAENNVIVGYTDDLSSKSDWDDWHTKDDHDKPVTPPSGGGDDDDPWHGVNFGGSSGGGGAFAKFYYMTSTELANLRSWMNSNNVPEGFNPMAQIIGLSQVPVAIGGSAPENVMFVNSAAIYDEGQNRVVDSNVATQRGSGSSIIYNLGSVEIPRRMQQRGEPYLDYSCAIELYLPFCGVFSLDTQAVMGRTITAQLALDPTSGSITGYAWVENGGEKLPVAYGSGQAGVDLPISAQQYGMSKAALSQANAAFAQSMFQTAIQAMTYAATSGMSSAESAGDAAYARGGRGAYSAVRNAEKGALSNEVGTYVKSQASSNVVGGFLNWGRALKEISYGNNTAISGSFGGSYASWSNPFTAYVKIIRPKFQKPDNYNHTQAVPCVEAKTVGSCTGLIQCIGVDTSSITNATSIERDAIAAALSNGVYAGGGN